MESGISLYCGLGASSDAANDPLSIYCAVFVRLLHFWTRRDENRLSLLFHFEASSQLSGLNILI
jgi:hypothetical protein